MPTIADIAKQYQHIALPVSTLYSQGTACCLKNFETIVTSEAIIHGQNYAVLQTPDKQKHLAPVQYADTQLGIALLEWPSTLKAAPVTWQTSIPQTGQQIYALGPAHCPPTPNTIIKIEASGGATYVQCGYACNTESLGGPLVDMAGQIIGIQTHLPKQAPNTHWAISTNSLHQAIQQLPTTTSLNTLTPGLPPIAQTIENLLAGLGYAPLLARLTPYSWQIQRGSATVHITYHAKTGYIIGDARLCRLPKTNSEAAHQYLLQQNYHIEGLTLSIHEQHVILSAIIHDRYLNPQSGLRLLHHLFERADYYDNVLVEKYGAYWP